MKLRRLDQSYKQQGGYVYEQTESPNENPTGKQSEPKLKKSTGKSLCEKWRERRLRKRQDIGEKSSLEQEISRLFDEVKALGYRMGTMQAEMERLGMLGEMQQKETERLRDMIERGQRDAQFAQRSGDLLQPHNSETQKDLERENSNLQQGNDELKRYIDKLKKINDELKQKLKEANGFDRGYPIESYLPTIKEEIESALSLKCNPEKGEWYFLKIRENVETIAKMIRMYEDQRRR